MDAEISSRIELKVLAEDDVANDVHGSTKELLGTNELSIIKNFWKKSNPHFKYQNCNFF